MGKKVLVIGGGIVGLSSAYFLMKGGHEVQLIDRSNMDSGASHINAGYVTPSHFVSLASPKMVSKGLKYMFNASSPFYMAPRWNTDFFKWAWYFKKSSTKANVQRAMVPIRDINLLGREIFEDLLSSNSFGDFHLENKGLLMVYKTEKERDLELSTFSNAEKLGLEANHLDHQALQQLEPHIELNALGAFHYLCDRHTTPTTFIRAIQRSLENGGVSIHKNERVIEFECKHDSAKTLRTDKTSYEFDELVLASGVWSAELAKKMDLKLPLEAGKGYGINVASETHISMPALLLESKIAVTPMHGFTRFAGTMEFSGINKTIKKNRVEAIAQGASGYYKGLKIPEMDKKNASCGLRPVTPDGLPYIGRTQKIKNVVIATGHAMMGWSTGPATGKLVSELISDKKLSINIQPFHPERRF